MAIPLAQELTELITFKVADTPVSERNIATAGATVCTAYARITDMGGMGIDATDMQHQASGNRFEVWTQYNPLITAYLQIAWGSRTLSIVEAPQLIEDRNRRKWMLISAEESTENDLT